MWGRHLTWSAMRAFETLKFVTQQAHLAQSLADEAAVQVSYAMQSPCVRHCAADGPSCTGRESSGFLCGTFGLCGMPSPDTVVTVDAVVKAAHSKRQSAARARPRRRQRAGPLECVPDGFL